MPERRAYKTDESFLEKLAIGANGTKFVFDDLRQYDHAPVELERGSRSFKLWKAIKIKRVRVPDLLCTRCGLRVESRAKTKLEISMSHSRSQAERGWDFGMLDDDRVALVVCGRVGDRPIDWAASPPVQYLLVRDLRQAFKSNAVRTTEAKGAQEGFEIRLTWPAAVADEPGTVTALSEQSLQYRTASGRVRTVRLLRNGGRTLIPTVRVGESVEPHQILAAVVPVATTFLCKPLPDPVAYFTRLLTSPNLSDRYGAVKGLASHLAAPVVAAALHARMADDREHIFVQLEAAANLMRLGDQRAQAFFDAIVEDEYLQNRLEAVIILGELPSAAARALLTKVLLAETQHPEIRAGAAWSLGELQDRQSLSTLVQSLEETDEGIRIEAARALAKLARIDQAIVLRAFANASETRRPGLAWSLSKAGDLKLDDLLPTLTGLDARQWGSWLLGTQAPEEFVKELERLRAADPEVYFAATVLWKVMASWVDGLEEY